MPFTTTRASRSVVVRDRSELIPNHSAVMSPPIDQLTVDGYDMTWGTNALGMKLSQRRRKDAPF